MLPGVPRLYATAVPFAGIAQPVLGVTSSGRPIKLEGNPDHPASLGATDAFTQAMLLDLYDPDRSQSVRHAGRPVGWNVLAAALAGRAARLGAAGGGGFSLPPGGATFA